MKIIVAGAAEVGTHLAKLLAKENMDVVLIDADPDKIGQLTFMNLMTMVGSPTSITSLKEAGVPSCDLFIAVTPDESVNIHACILAANMGARKTVARIDNRELLTEQSTEFYKRIGISHLVYPEMLAGQAVASAIMRPWARQSYDLCEGKLTLIGVKVYAGAPIVGQSLVEVGKKHHDHFHIAAIKRVDDLLIPGGMDVVQAGDLVYFVTMPDKIDVLRHICGKANRQIRRVVLMGGSRIGVQTCFHLPDDYDILFIEPSRARAEELMELVPRAHVIQGEVADQGALSSVDLGDSDVLVALGVESGPNILACLAAKKMGVGKTVAEIPDVEYISMATNLNIGSTVNKKIVTASAIYQLLLDADKTNAKCFSLVDAEVADLVAQEGSRIVEKPVMHLSLPKGITLGGLVRGGKGMTVTGQTQIQPGDRVVVVCLNEKISQVEKLFVR